MKTLIATLTITILSLNLFAQGAANAYRFDGDNDAIEIGSVDFGFEDEITVMGWMKWNVDPKTGDSWANIVSINKSSRSDQGQFWIQHDQNNNKLEFALELENGRQFIWSNTHVKKGEWVHFAGTYDGSVQRFYINGVEEGHKKRSGNIRAFEPDFTATIGKWAANNGARYFNGDLDEISIWNRALSEDEIRDLMTEKLQGTETGLLAYYQFDSLDESTLVDAAGSYDALVTESQLVISTAPVGDESVYTYGGNDLELESSDNSVLVSDFTGNPDGVHIYKVTSSPNTVEVENADINEVIDNEYWGVFVVGNRESTFRYTKKLTPSAGVPLSDSLTIVYRDNAGDIWKWQDINQNLSESEVFFYTEGGFAQREYILAKADPSLLPIELLSFNVTREETSVLIRWETASESNNDFFTVQRSVDGSTWDNIAYISGSGNSNQTLHYEYADYNPENGVSYYRLKQTDFDGKFEVFDMQSIDMTMLIPFEVSVYPNPVVNNLTIETNNKGTVSVILTNNSGQMLESAVSDGSGIAGMNVESLPSGTYFLILTDDNGNKTTQKILKR